MGTLPNHSYSSQPHKQVTPMCSMQRKARPMAVGFAPTWGHRALREFRVNYATVVSALDTDTRRPTHQPLATPIYILLSTDRSVGVMGGLDRQINASPNGLSCHVATVT